MNVWYVERWARIGAHVSADYMELWDGSLCFYRNDIGLYKVFAPKCWETVKLSEDLKDS